MSADAETSDTTIATTARVLKNEIHVGVGRAQWIAKPLPALKGSLAGALSALFSTRYDVFRETETEGRPVAHISYRPLKDEILIQVEETKWHVKSTAFGPLTFSHLELDYAIHEKMTGRFAVLQGESVIAEGQCKFRSVLVSEYPKELEELMVYLSIGLLIRTLVGELAV